MMLNHKSVTPGSLRLLAQSPPWSRKLLLIAFVIGMAALGCIQSGGDRYDPYAVAPPEQGLHGVDPQRLHYLMARLSEMHLDQIPEDELDDPQPDPNLIRAAGMGEAMVADAKGMPAIVSEGMTPAEKRTLSRHASTYRREAAELARADARQDVPRVRRALVAVTQSCIACHVSLGGPHFAFDNSPEASEQPGMRDSQPGRRESRPGMRDSRPGHRGRSNAPPGRRGDQPPPREQPDRPIEPDIDDQL